MYIVDYSSPTDKLIGLCFQNVVGESHDEVRAAPSHVLNAILLQLLNLCRGPLLANCIELHNYIGVRIIQVKTAKILGEILSFQGFRDKCILSRTNSPRFVMSSIKLLLSHI